MDGLLSTSMNEWVNEEYCTFSEIKVENWESPNENKYSKLGFDVYKRMESNLDQ